MTQKKEQTEKQKSLSRALRYVGTGLLGALIGVGSVAYFTAIDNAQSNDYTVKLKDNTVVAKINGEKIVAGEITDRLLYDYGSQLLDDMIADRLIELEIKNNKITVTEEEIQDELDNLIKHYESEEAMYAEYARTGKDESMLKEDIERYLKSKKLYSSLVEATDQEIEDYFNENKDSLGKDEEVRLSHILVDTEGEANKVYQSLQDGEDFGKLAEEYSTDKSNSHKDGDMGYFVRGDLQEDFEEVAFATPKGEYSKPIKMDYGYHIIKVTDRKDPIEPTLENTREEIIDIIKDGKLREVYSSWLEELKVKYKVDNKLNSLMGVEEGYGGTNTGGW